MENNLFTLTVFDTLKCFRALSSLGPLFCLHILPIYQIVMLAGEECKQLFLQIESQFLSVLSLDS